MKKLKKIRKYIPVSLIIVLLTGFNAISLNAQEISFTFTANHTCEYAALDSIFIENLTKGGDTTLYYPDTVLTIAPSGINEIPNGVNGFYVSQNYPNPFETKTDIDVFVPERNDVSLNVYDLLGRKVANYEGTLERGMQHFTFFAGNAISYILTVSTEKHLQHIQMIQFGKVASTSPYIVYHGSATREEPKIKQKSLESYFPYELGDQLRFTGYVSGDYTSITDSPATSEEYFFDINNAVPAQPGAISGNATVCENATGEVYSISPVNGASSYTWTVPSDASIVSGEGTTSIIVNFGINSGDICVTADNGCGASEQTCSAITVNTAPSITIQPSDETNCEGGNTSFSVTATGTGLTYQWQVNTGSDWNNITAAGSDPTYVNWTTATLGVNSVVASNDGYQYRCVVSGSCTPSATSNSANLSVCTCVCGECVIIVDVTNGTTGDTWMDRNLGASQQATSSTDYNAYGALFQWGRLSDGHECITWTGSGSGTPDNGTTSTLSSSDNPGHSLFITPVNSPYDWRSPQNDNLWQGVSGINNPCPSGYRLPTETELNNERLSWSTNNSAGAYGSPLKLPVAGARYNQDGSLGDTGSNGYYWNSTVDGTSAKALNFYGTDAGMFSTNRSGGYSVRCIKD